MTDPDTFTLHLGVIDQPYRTPPAQAGLGKTGRPGKKRTAQRRAMTTYDVARILEARYHIMETFFEANREELTAKIADAYAGAIETALMRNREPVDPGAMGFGALKTRFNKFLDDEELADLGVPGVPTQAALDGVSHRFKRPYQKRARRPSFIDTGLYEASFIAWTDSP